MSAKQELFDRLYYYSQDELKFDTYDMLPEEDAPYPFVHFGATEEDENPLKAGTSGRITQTINIWGSADMRFEVSDIMDTLIVERVRTQNYVFTRHNKQTQILSDSSVPNTRLIHGIITLVFDYFKN